MTLSLSLSRTAGANTTMLRAHSAETPATRFAMIGLAGGVFFAAYLTWRPFEVMFTLSDALFCVAAVGLAIGNGLHLRPFGALTPWWLLAYITMVSGLLVGTIANGEPLRWSVAAAQYGFAMIVLPCLLIGHGADRTLWLAKIMLAGVVAMEAFGIGVYFLSSGGYEDHQRLGIDFISGSRRLGAFPGDANWNGAYIAMCLPFIVYLHGKRQLPGWLALIAAAVLIEGLLLSASVSAILSATVAVAATLVVGWRRLPIWPFAAGAAGIVVYVAAGLPLPQAFGNRVAPAIGSGSIDSAGTFSGRYDLMREAWQMVGDTTFVGIGFDQFRQVSMHGAPVHNMYLLLWSEGGTLALFGWLAMIGMLVAGAIAVMRLDRMTSALALSVVAVFAVSSNASPHMYARLWMVPVAMAMAFVFEFSHRKEPR
jgi:O-antigen ligase